MTVRGRLWLPVAALWTAAWAVAAFMRAHHHRSTDWDALRVGARGIVGIDGITHVSPLHVYAQSPYLPAGPPALLLDGLAQWAFGRNGGYAGDKAVLVIIIALGVVAAWALSTLTRSARVPLVAAPLLAVWGWGFGGFGHLEDAIAISAALLAVVALRRDMPIVAGLLVGLAVASKPWGLLFLPLLVMTTGRGRSRALLAAVAVPALCWLPFFAADAATVRVVTGVRYAVTPGSTLAAVGFHVWQSAPGFVREVQLLVGGAVTFAVARRYWPGALLAAVTARVLFDPAAWFYYGIGVVAGSAVLDISRRSRVPWFTTVAMVAEYVVPAVAPARVAGVVRLVWAVGTVGALLVMSPSDAGGGRLGRQRERVAATPDGDVAPPALGVAAV